MFTRRAIARLIDTTLLAAVIIGIGFPFGFGVSWLLLGGLLTIGYLAGSTARWGATVGKRLAGLRVVSNAGDQRPTWPQALRREALNSIGAIPFAGPILFVAFWGAVAITARRSPTGVGINDRLAPNTRVIRDPGRLGA